jgi:hypothetical protein
MGPGRCEGESGSIMAGKCGQYWQGADGVARLEKKVTCDMSLSYSGYDSARENILAL